MRSTTIAQRSRAGKLKPDDFSGGTYTLSNSGTFGTLITAPIINQPQVAILSTDGVRKKPVVVESFGRRLDRDPARRHPRAIVRSSRRRRRVLRGVPGQGSQAARERATGSSKSEVGMAKHRSDGSAPAVAWASRWRSACSRPVTRSAVYNRTRSKVEPLAELGATIVDRRSELRGRDIVFTTVSASDDLIAVCFGPDGLLGEGPARRSSSSTARASPRKRPRKCARRPRSSAPTCSRRP